MGRGRTVTLWTAAILGATAIGAGISSQIPYMPFVDELFRRTPTPAAIMQGVVTTSPSPQPLFLTSTQDKCVPPELRETWTVKEGQTLWEIAEATLKQGEDRQERMRYIQEFNLIADPRLLQIGQKLITRNAGLMPKLYVPESALAYLQLMEMQPLSLQAGIEGLLCGTKIRPYLTSIPTSRFKFDDATATFNWTPWRFQGGEHYVSFYANDGNVAVTADIILRVKTGTYELVTDGNPEIKYKVVPATDGLSPVLTLDGKTGYFLDAYQTINKADVVSAQELAANPEVALAIAYQRKAKNALPSGSDLLRALDDLRRRLEPGQTEKIAPFYFPAEIGGKERTVYWFPMLGEEVKLAAALD